MLQGDCHCQMCVEHCFTMLLQEQSRLGEQRYRLKIQFLPCSSVLQMSRTTHTHMHTNSGLQKISIWNKIKGHKGKIINEKRTATRQRGLQYSFVNLGNVQYVLLYEAIGEHGGQDLLGREIKRPSANSQETHWLQMRGKRAQEVAWPVKAQFRARVLTHSFK